MLVLTTPTPMNNRNYTTLTVSFLTEHLIQEFEHHHNSGDGAPIQRGRHYEGTNKSNAT